MRAAEEIFERLLGLLKRKDAVHHRPDAMPLVERDHLLEPVAGSIQYALQGDVSSQGEDIDVRPVVRLVHFAGQIPDAVDQAAPGDAVEALPQRLRAAGFKDDVCAVLVRELQHFLLPVGLVAVVDDEVGA